MTDTPTPTQARIAARRNANPRTSLVVPVFNEAETVELFVDTLCPLLDEQGIDFEILFVNDGSQDNTLEVITNRIARESRIRMVNLSRNFGKEAALTAGLDHAAGEVVIPIDVDLQDPPELIPVFLERWRQGYDVVYGMRTNRDSDTVSKRASANWFYRAFNAISNVQIPENVGDFRLMDRRVVEVIKNIPERNRFMKGLFAWVGFNSIGIRYERPSRSAGTTKWNHWSLWNFALDGLASFSTLPLRVWTYLGGIIAFLSFAYGVFIIVRVLLFGVDIPGYASLLTTVLFLGGVQLLSVGILGEYLGRLITETKRRPLYVVDGIYPELDKQD